MVANLRLNGLTKSYPRFSLSNVSFEIQAGRILGFVGPNGAGKTTTIKIVMGLRKRDAGGIEVMGRPVRDSDSSYRRHISFVYDESFYWGSLSPREIGTIVRRMSGHFDDSKFKALLDKYELPRQQRIGTYSKGMKTKFALAVALARKCEIVVLDEPTSGLDPIVRRLVLEELTEYARDRNAAVLFSTHILADIEAVANSVAIIVDGTVELCASPNSISSGYEVVSLPVDWKPGRDLEHEVRIVRDTSGSSVLVPRDLVHLVHAGGGTRHERASLDDVLYHMVRSRHQQGEGVQ